MQTAQGDLIGHPVPGSDIIFDISLGYQLNRNVMDAFAGVSIPGENMARAQHHASPVKGFLL